METQMIVNLLNVSENAENEHAKFAIKNGMLLTVNQKVITHLLIQ